MTLKKKLFEFGIYGKPVKNLTENELNEAKECNWVEFITPEQQMQFKTTFTINPISADKNIKENTIVRMNLHAWRAYLFGPDFRTKNHLYFLIVDYLLQENDYTAASVLRAKFNIEPKTMFYNIKKLKEMNVILEKKHNNESIIKLNEINDKSEHQKTKEDVKIESTQTDSPRAPLIYYNNLTINEQIKYHIDCSISGIGTKELNQLYGMCSKVALKRLQRICILSPEKYKMVDLIDNKHTAFKVFNIFVLDERNRKKLQSMAEDEVKTEDTCLSSKDRQEALKILANKYQHFKLTKKILAEFKFMTGYPYEIDKKNLIKNAVIAGLTVCNIRDTVKHKWAIGLAKYTENELNNIYKSSEISNMLTGIENKPADSKLLKSLKKYFIHNEEFIVKDNGYMGMNTYSEVTLFDFIKSLWCIKADSGKDNELSENEPAFDQIDINVDNYKDITNKTENNKDNYLKESQDDISDSFIHFDCELINRMNVGLFYQIMRIRHSLFKAKCAYEIYQKNQVQPLSNQEVSAELNKVCIKTLFREEEDPKRLTEGMDYVMKLTDKLELREYYNSLSEEYKKFIREYIKPYKFIKLLRKLQKTGAVELKIDSMNRIYVKCIKVPEITNNYSTGYLKYNTRVSFVNLCKGLTENSNEDTIKKIISQNFDEHDTMLLNDTLNNFIKKTKTVVEAKLFKLTPIHKQIYLIVKKAISFDQPVDCALLSQYSQTTVTETLEYMLKKDIIAGYRSIATLQNTIAHNKYKGFLGAAFPFVSDSQLITNFIYFSKLLVKVKEIVTTAGSIDLEQILHKMKYYEEFELQMLFEEFTNEFTVKLVDGFQFVSNKDIYDPFE